MTDDYAVSCATDGLEADPSARAWRCPDCRDGVLLGADFLSRRYVGRILGCSNCQYWERV
ncbi:MAG: hypothetical protein ABEJ35_02665 [Halobacteriaceae archaeon]